MLFSSLLGCEKNTRNVFKKNAPKTRHCSMKYKHSLVCSMHWACIVDVHPLTVWMQYNESGVVKRLKFVRPWRTISWRLQNEPLVGVSRISRSGNMVKRVTIIFKNFMGMFVMEGDGECNGVKLEAEAHRVPVPP